MLICNCFSLIILHFSIVLVGVRINDSMDLYFTKVMMQDLLNQFISTGDMDSFNKCIALYKKSANETTSTVPDAGSASIFNTAMRAYVEAARRQHNLKAKTMYVQQAHWVFAAYYIDRACKPDNKALDILMKGNSLLSFRDTVSQLELYKQYEVSPDRWTVTHLINGMITELRRRLSRLAGEHENEKARLRDECSATIGTYPRNKVELRYTPDEVHSSLVANSGSLTKRDVINYMKEGNCVFLV